MKPKEKEIIKHLREGKRANISEIARRIGLPISTVNDCVRRIEKNYVIKRASLIDYTKIGYLANAILAIKAERDNKYSILEYLKKQSCVNSIFHVDAGFSFVIEVIFKDNLEMKNWTDEIKSKFDIELMQFQILKVEEKEIFVPE
jgi:DNA-binding Lrp family transcriptional regulator